ncbi:nucleoid-structuring protein H-NS, partial [Pseudomonas ogarae]
MRSAKVSKTLLPHHLVPRLGSACPHSGIAPWARREGPSMAQRGYLGIHAEVPTAQYLRSA